MTILFYLFTLSLCTSYSINLGFSSYRIAYRNSGNAAKMAYFSYNDTSIEPISCLIDDNFTQSHLENWAIGKHAINISGKNDINIFYDRTKSDQIIAFFLKTIPTQYRFYDQVTVIVPFSYPSANRCYLHKILSLIGFNNVKITDEVSVLAESADLEYAGKSSKIVFIDIGRSHTSSCQVEYIRKEDHFYSQLTKYNSNISISGEKIDETLAKGFAERLNLTEINSSFTNIISSAKESLYDNSSIEIEGITGLNGEKLYLTSSDIKNYSSEVFKLFSEFILSHYSNDVDAVYILGGQGKLAAFQHLIVEKFNQSSIYLSDGNFIAASLFRIKNHKRVNSVQFTNMLVSPFVIRINGEDVVAYGAGDLTTEKTFELRHDQSLLITIDRRDYLFKYDYIIKKVFGDFRRIKRVVMKSNRLTDFVVKITVGLSKKYDAIDLLSAVFTYEGRQEQLDISQTILESIVKNYDELIFNEEPDEPEVSHNTTETNQTATDTNSTENNVNTTENNSNSTENNVNTIENNVNSTENNSNSGDNNLNTTKNSNQKDDVNTTKESNHSTIEIDQINKIHSTKPQENVKKFIINASLIKLMLKNENRKRKQRKICKNYNEMRSTFLTSVHTQVFASLFNEEERNEIIKTIETNFTECKMAPNQKSTKRTSYLYTEEQSNREFTPIRTIKQMKASFKSNFTKYLDALNESNEESIALEQLINSLNKCSKELQESKKTDDVLNEVNETIQEGYKLIEEYKNQNISTPNRITTKEIREMTQKVDSKINTLTKSVFSFNFQLGMKITKEIREQLKRIGINIMNGEDDDGNNEKANDEGDQKVIIKKIIHNDHQDQEKPSNSDVNSQAQPTQPPATPSPQPTQPPATPSPQPTQPPATPSPQPPATPSPQPTQPPATPSPQPTQPPVTPSPQPTQPPATPSPQPTQPPVTPSPQPTQPPATPSPQPTQPPATPSPQPTQPPATPSPQPTQPPATPSPQPTQPPATPSPQPTQPPATPSPQPPETPLPTPSSTAKTFTELPSSRNHNDENDEYSESEL